MGGGRRAMPNQLITQHAPVVGQGDMGLAAAVRVAWPGTSLKPRSLARNSSVAVAGGRTRSDEGQQREGESNVWDVRIVTRTITATGFDGSDRA